MLKYLSIAATTLLSTLMLYSDQKPNTLTPMRPSETTEQTTTNQNPSLYHKQKRQIKKQTTKELVSCLEDEIDGKIRFNSQGPVFYLNQKNWPVIIKYGIIRPLDGEPGVIKKNSIEEEQAWKEYIKAINDVEEKNNAILCYKKNNTQFQKEEEEKPFAYKFNIRLKMPNICKGIYGIIRLNCNKDNNNIKSRLSFSNPDDRYTHPDYYQMHIKAFAKIIGTNKIPKTKLVIHKWEHDWNNYTKKYFLKDLEIKLIKREGGVIKIKPQKIENLDEILEDDFEEEEEEYSKELIEEVLEEIKQEMYQERANKFLIPIQSDELCYCGLETQESKEKYLETIIKNNPQENPTNINQRFKEIEDNCSEPIDYQGQQFDFLCSQFEEQEE